MSASCVLLSLFRPRDPSGPSLRALHRGLLSVRRMSSRRQMDHLQRTAAQSRQTALYPAQVCGLTDESDAVKRLRLTVHPDFSFKAGQWVDLFIPGLETVGGFSMCSSPGQLQREGVIELAVKYAKHPPAHWVHTQCTTGSQVALRVGGDFFFDPAPSDPSLDLLLVAGGVGINPVYSILLHTADLLRLKRANVSSAHMCYSAKSTQQLLFKRSIVDMCEEFPSSVSCEFHVTQQSSEVESSLQPYTSRGRVTAEHLQAHVHPQTTLCYLCGPPPMIQDLSGCLKELGLPRDRILFEKWW
ncbi:hypothetical protein WMY93_019437 [Mugilogobius chulae]|uniref:Oxidoreductase NAD-binding domain-containing protein 1 n=1 Tax=Mugilogobius chulae TaxID=88201 RepID=A0AAW0NJT1_9GOBI